MPCVIVSSQVVVGITLTLHDQCRREVGSLIVQLLDSAMCDLEQRLPTSPPVPESVQNAADLAAEIQDLGSGLVTLKQGGQIRGGFCQIKRPRRVASLSSC